MLVGIIIGLYSFSNILGNIVSGFWIDRIGPKKVLSVGMLSVGVILFFYSVAANPQQLVIIRFLHGFAGGLIVPAAFTFLGTMKTEKSKGKVMAFSGASVGAAAVIGPAIGAIISGRFGYNWLFYFITVIILVFAILAMIFTKEQLSDKKSLVPQESKPLSITRALIYAYISIFSLLFTLGILTFALPVKVDELNLSSELTGPLLSVFGIVAILFFILPTNRLYDRMKNMQLMTIGLITISLALLGLSLSATFLHLLFAMTVYGIGFACFSRQQVQPLLKVPETVNAEKPLGCFMHASLLELLSVLLVQVF